MFWFCLKLFADVYSFHDGDVRTFAQVQYGNIMVQWGDASLAHSLSVGDVLVPGLSESRFCKGDD